VVYDGDERETQYESVVASGTLEEIDPERLSVEQIEQYGRAQRPLFETWGHDKERLDIRLYELRPAELSGRRTVLDRKEGW